MSLSIKPTSLKGGSIVGPLKPEDAAFCCAPIEKPSERKQHVPRGLQNVGNTCYSNAVLQCLLSTALSDVLLHRNAAVIFRRYSSNPSLLVEGTASAESDASDDILRKAPSSPAHREKRHKGRFDERMQNTCEWLTKELTDITRDYVRVSRPANNRTSSPSLLASLLGGSPSGTTRRDQAQVVVDPGTITRHPDRLNKCLRPYQQEDAHEFLRSLLATLVMNGHNRKLSSLFDGLLESAVRCQSCDHSSLTRDRYMDLSLDIDGVKTLPEALDRFTETEILDGDNKVFCDECACKRTVTKTLRLATAPSILVCHLKRFAMDHYGRTQRLNNHVRFPLRLEIGESMSRVNKAKPPPYELVGVLVHKGRTCDSGHYLAFIKSGEQWFKANDSVVTPVDVDVVLSQQAYLLFYEVAEMRNKEGFTTPHAYRLPHPNLAQPVQTASDDNSVPSNASTVVSDDDEHDAGGVCYSWLSTLVSDTLLLGDLCCQPLDSGHRRRNKGEGRPPHHIVVDDSTLSTWESTESSSTLRRASRMCKSNSSGDLTHITERGRTPYNPHPSVAPPRTLSFGRRSDPGGGGGPGRIDPYARRGRSNSEKRRKRDGKLPPRPFHARRHSGFPPGGLGY